MGAAIPVISLYGANLSEWQVKVMKVKNTAANATQEYKPMEINNINPADILPIIGQIET